MCFTPLVSIITTLLEFGIAGYLFYKIRDKKLYPLVIFVLLLGLYQFTEFMLCASSNAIFWARIGFSAYTFMPILLYHFFINVSRNKIKNIFYLIPTFFALLALFYPNFISYTSCNLIHVTAESLIFNRNLVLMFFYLAYYLYFPIYGVYVFSRMVKYSNTKFSTKLSVVVAPFVLLVGLLYYFWSTIYENDQIQTWIYTSAIIITSLLILILLSLFLFKKSKILFYQTNSLILATTGLTIVLLYYIIPNISLNYSSIFCHFALLYGIASVLLINSLNGRVPNY